MNHAEWLTSTDPAAMMRYLRWGTLTTESVASMGFNVPPGARTAPRCSGRTTSTGSTVTNWELCDDPDCPLCKKFVYGGK